MSATPSSKKTAKRWFLRCCLIALLYLTACAVRQAWELWSRGTGIDVLSVDWANQGAVMEVATSDTIIEVVESVFHWAIWEPQHRVLPVRILSRGPGKVILLVPLTVRTWDDPWFCIRGARAQLDLSPFIPESRQVSDDPWRALWAESKPIR